MLFKVSFEKEIHILKSANTKTLQELKAMVPKVFKTYPERFYLCYLDEDGDQITLTTDNDFNILLKTNAKSAKIMIKEKSEDFYDETQQVQPEFPQQLQALMDKANPINEASVIHSSVPDKSLDQSIDEKLQSLLPDIISKIKKEVTDELMNKSKVEQPKYEKKKEQLKKQVKVIHKGYTCDGCQFHDIQGPRYRCSVCHNFDFCEKCQETLPHPHPFLKIKYPHQTPLKIICILNDENQSAEINGKRLNIPDFNNLINQGMNFVQQFVNQNKMPQPASNESPKESQKTEVKPETKVESKVQTKPIPKVQKTVQTKPVPKVQIKVEPKQVEIETKVPQISVIPVVKAPEAEKVDRKDLEQRVIQNANYLSNVLDVNFTKCFKFAEKNHGLSKEQLLDLFINTGSF